jgi:hypothetical protein
MNSIYEMKVIVDADSESMKESLFEHFNQWVWRDGNTQFLDVSVKHKAFEDEFIHLKVSLVDGKYNCFEAYQDVVGCGSNDTYDTLMECMEHASYMISSRIGDVLETYVEDCGCDPDCKKDCEECSCAGCNCSGKQLDKINLLQLDNRELKFQLEKAKAEIAELNKGFEDIKKVLADCFHSGVTFGKK